MMQILSICLLVLIILAHIVAVVAHQCGTADTGKAGQGGYKIGIVLFEPYFQVQLHLSGRCNLAFDYAARHMGCYKFLGLAFTCLI